LSTSEPSKETEALRRAMPVNRVVYFSEPLLRSLGLAIPFQAEYEGSIPFTRSSFAMNR
jgi:hypothetical protein